MNKDIRIAPSMASAPFADLEGTIKELESAGASYIHFDIEDGYFVPVMTLGTRIISQLRPFTMLPFDVHLMMVNPEWILPELKSWGVNRVSFHYEATQYPRRVLKKIQDLGMEAGLAFNPLTPLPDLKFLREYLSFVVILTTEPEEPEALFLPDILEKITIGRQVKALEGIDWVADGGITADNIRTVVQAGATVVVAGRSIFNNVSIKENMDRLLSAIEGN